MTTNYRVLCVDDEPRVLEGVERTLFELFELVTTSKPEEAVALLEDTSNPFAVILSDMRMPGMDGATLLAHAREVVPETTRILLTGHADLEAAAAAVNRANVFRFLCKPCSPEVLITAITAGVEQHRILGSERELLEQTLTGSVRLLSEVLSLVAPEIFASTQRIRALVLHMAKRSKQKDLWKFELASGLSLIGCVVLPDDTVSRALSGLSLETEERRAFTEHPLTAHRLLSEIPRFREVAEMILRQMPVEAPESTPEIELGGTMLRVAREVDRMLRSGASLELILRRLPQRLSDNERAQLALLDDFPVASAIDAIRALRVNQMTAEMLLEEDVRTTAGVVVVPKGRHLTLVLIEQLLRFSRAKSLVEPIRVRVPT